MNTATPRMDRAVKEANGIAALLAPFARTLERELGEANRLYHLASSLASAGDELRDQLRAEVEVWKSLFSATKGDHDRILELRAEVERLKLEKFDCALASKDRDRWRAVADGLKMALANDGMEANNLLSSIARYKAIAEYEKMKGGK